MLNSHIHVYRLIPTKHFLYQELKTALKTHVVASIIRIDHSL